MERRNIINVIEGSKPPAEYDLDSFGKDCVRFGRGPVHGDGGEANDICVGKDVTAVSRAHCSFCKYNGEWFICDDNSMNGLLLNGVKVQSQQMRSGDRFSVVNDTDLKCIIAFFSYDESRENENVFHLSGKQRFVIGRSRDCDIIISHPSVSRNHCVITCENGEYYIADNNSTNGVILNGMPLKKKQCLKAADKITIADTSMVFSGGCLYFSLNKDGVSVSACGVTKRVRSGRGVKAIADNISLTIEPGEFTAIIGGSGAGKTTLLNCLSGMTDFDSGDVFINGESIKSNSRSIKSIIGYVPQNDIIYDNLTLERMLYHSAKLRMPKDTGKEEIMKKIDETLELVELTDHRKTVISKLSGGQKKRASIAVELLASPKLFFLDEPSSGLDPGTEKNLMKLLKNLAASGKTVIMVTHTVQNINICDRVVCMGNGGLLCYSGKPSDALKFFEKTEFSDIYGELNDNAAAVADKFQSINSAAGASDVPDKSGEKRRKDFLSGFRQFSVLTKRYAEITFNSMLRLVMLLLMPLILSLLVCLAFQSDGDLFRTLGIEITRTSMPFLTVGDTMSLMFAFSCAAFWVGIFNSVQEISKERSIYSRECFAGVKPLPYVMSKFAVSGVLCVIQSAIMTVIFLLLTDTSAVPKVNPDDVLSMSLCKNGVVFTNGGNAFEIFITVLLTVICAMCLGLAISAAVSNDMALVLCPVCLLPQILFSGIACTLSGFTEKLAYFITCRWSCIAFLTSSRVNNMYASCYYQDGWQMIKRKSILKDYVPGKEYLFGLDPVRSAWTALGIMSVVCLAAAMLLLYIRNRSKLRTK